VRRQETKLVKQERLGSAVGVKNESDWSGNMKRQNAKKVGEEESTALPDGKDHRNEATKPREAK